MDIDKSNEVVTFEEIKHKLENKKLEGVNGKIICRKMAKKNVVFPTYFLYHEFMI